MPAAALLFAGPARAGDLAANAAALVTAAPDEPTALAGAPVDGLYPLWEQTAIVHPLGTVEVGYEHAEVGLGRVELGTQPIDDLHGTANAQAKVSLWRGERFQLALTIGGYRLPTAAESRTVGNLYPTGFANPYAPVWLMPISVAKSLRLGQRVTLHWSSTLMISRSSDSEFNYISGGQAVMAEFAANPRWKVRLHAGAEGWPVQTMAHAGLSFGYTGKYVFATAGVARRFYFDGEAANMTMLDAGILFR